jgi:hypothetical protein
MAVSRLSASVLGAGRRYRPDRLRVRRWRYYESRIERPPSMRLPRPRAGWSLPCHPAGSNDSSESSRGPRVGQRSDNPGVSTTVKGGHGAVGRRSRFTRAQKREAALGVLTKRHTITDAGRAIPAPPRAKGRYARRPRIARAWCNRRWREASCRMLQVPQFGRPNLPSWSCGFDSRRSPALRSKASCPLSEPLSAATAHDD